MRAHRRLSTDPREGLTRDGFALRAHSKPARTLRSDSRLLRALWPPIKVISRTASAVQPLLALPFVSSRRCGRPDDSKASRERIAHDDSAERTARPAVAVSTDADAALRSLDLAPGVRAAPNFAREQRVFPLGSFPENSANEAVSGGDTPRRHPVRCAFQMRPRRKIRRQVMRRRLALPALLGTALIGTGLLGPALVASELVATCLTRGIAHHSSTEHRGFHPPRMTEGSATACAAIASLALVAPAMSGPEAS